MSLPSAFFVTSIMTTLGATVSKTFSNALFNWCTTSFPGAAAAGGMVGVAEAAGAGFTEAAGAGVAAGGVA